MRGFAKYLCVFQSNIKNTPNTLSAERTTCQYAQHHGMPFVRRVPPVSYAAIRFCDFDQTRDVTEVNPDFVRNRRVVVRQDVEAMGFVGGEAIKAAPSRVRCRPG